MTAPLALFRLAVVAELLAALAVAITLVFVAAPYGRHLRAGWGPGVGVRRGWFLMEGTSLAAFLLTFAHGRWRAEVVPLLFLAAWSIHYLYRSVVYPRMTRPHDRSMPVVIVVSGAVFNLLNAWLNARWVSHLGHYEVDWLLDPRMLIGLSLMAGGFAIHLHSDSILVKLRPSGESGYRIPQRGLHRWVASPNYLGEILEWAGWALATWSLAGLAFALFTVANLAPRALANLRWYRETFEDYPARRKALLPYLF